jgi:ATP-dependent helicase HrpA
LSNGQKVLTDITEIFTQWQQVRRELLVLDQDIFGRSIDDIEDQLI